MINYNVSSGTGNVEITSPTIPNLNGKASANVLGDGDVDDSVSVQFQQSNDSSGGWKNIGSAITSDENTNEFIDLGDFNGKFIRAVITVGSATLGVISIIMNYKK